MPIDYRVNAPLDVDVAIDLYVASTLGERRPVGDRDRMSAMLANADLVVTAWDGDVLVGIARSISDRVYTTYCADLAVRASHQRRGIGLELLRRTRAECSPQCRLVLLAAPAAEGYYPRIGMVRHPSAWHLPGGEPLGGEHPTTTPHA